MHLYYVYISAIFWNCYQIEVEITQNITEIMISKQVYAIFCMLWEIEIIVTLKYDISIKNII